VKGRGLVRQHLHRFRNCSEHVLNSYEICAGAGGQALGLSQVGFYYMALVESEKVFEIVGACIIR
jgi:hypothetical protein